MAQAFIMTKANELGPCLNSDGAACMLYSRENPEWAVRLKGKRTT